ncbi:MULTISPECIES: efflux RND transporter periplasmic adaptor subunit [unclassified Microcoleus]|uniref:efflux RND transporter periplasmic adaptor subunit n=1 Tax=unclassified Microcoleus TaxID=2642155 RepID=UPI002FD013A7
MIEEIISDSRNGTRPKVSDEHLKLNEQPTQNFEIVDKIPNDTVPEVALESPSLPESEPTNNILAKEPKPQKVLAKGRIAMFLLGLLLLGGLGFLVWQRAIAPKPEKASRRGGKMQITPVLVATATKKTVPIQLQAIGTVQSGATVSVTAQASGRVTGVYFKKGQEVKKGQLLFSIDDRSQNASIQQAQGIVAKDRAQVQQATANLAKDQGIVEQARATLDKDRGIVEQARATLQKDLGVVEQAKMTLAKDKGVVEQAKMTLEKDLGAVKQAMATLSKDRAQAEYAEAQSQRYAELYKQGVISQDQAQQYATSSRAAAATVELDKQAIANAETAVKSDRIGITNAESVVKGDSVAIANAETAVKSDLVGIENAQTAVKSDLVGIDNARAVVDGDRSAIEGAQASVSADGGSLQNAQVQSSYTKVFAPIDGRAGNILVTEGNVVQPSTDKPLVTISKINPIQVAFSVPESNLSDIQKYVDNGKLKVDVTFAGNNRPISGTLSFVNNTVDNSTGSIQLIGDFNNADGKLFPGQFVNTTLTLSQQPNAIVVPSQAVQTGPNGQFVFVAQDDDTVDNVPVVVGNTIGGLSVIKKGVDAGDDVVTDGQANLVDGSKIRIKDAEDAKDNSDSSKGNNNSDTSKAKETGAKSGSDSNSSGNKSWKSPKNP